MKNIVYTGQPPKKPTNKQTNKNKNGKGSGSVNHTISTGNSDYLPGRIHFTQVEWGDFL